MNIKPALRQSDVKPLEFIFAVAVGGIGSTVLSALRVNPLVSVGFALLIMFVLTFLRWRIASEFKDYESLEAFAEDIYLLGYLLTLAALLGLAPRLMSDDANLFSIAGLKLVTTVVGLAMMMILRQTARRWAEEESRVSGDRFKEQQEVFTAAVTRLNEGADSLTAKLNEVVHRFDPGLLVPMAEWSNRAAVSFAAAAKSMELVHASVEKNSRSLNALNNDLERVGTASSELAGVFMSETGRAASALAVELGQAGKAASAMNGAVGALQPASESASIALQKLAGQAGLGVTQFNEISRSLDLVAVELGKVDGLLKAVNEVNSTDMKTPLNRLVEALTVSTTTTTDSTKHMETLKVELQSVKVASQDLARTMGAEIGKPLADHHQAVERVYHQMGRVDEQLEKVATQLEAINGAAQPGGEMLAQLLVRLGELQAELNETNVQIKSARQKVDGQPGPDGKTGIFRFFGGGR